jgi:drug/metabolite transporter (DMT)-like permease
LPSENRVRRRLTSEDVLLVIACLVWSANYSVVKVALAEISPLAFNGMRFSAAAVLLLLVQWRTRGFAPLRGHFISLIWLGLVGNLGYQLFFIFGIDNTRAGEASVFASTTPLFTYLVARISGLDRVGRRGLFGLLMASAGVVFLLWESYAGAFASQRNWVGDLLLLGSATCWAVYTVYSQPLLAKMDALSLTSVSMAVGAVPLALLALPDILEMRPAEVSSGAWLGLAYASFLAVVFSYLAWSRAVRILGSMRTAVYLNLVPVIAVVIAWVWLGESLTAGQVVGAGAVIGGIALSRSGGARAVEADEREQSRRAPAPTLE